MKEGLANSTFFKRPIINCLVLAFSITLLSNIFFVNKSYAASITWDGGGGDGKWETATNWDTDTVPTSGDDVTIDNVTTTLSLSQTASFNTLTIGSGTNLTELILVGNIGTGGSITIANNGFLTQSNTTTQLISGTLTVQSGGVLRHTANGATQSYIVKFFANNINIQSGGSVNVDNKGYGGSGPTDNGYGPGGGGYNFSGWGSGAGHGGNGGSANNYSSGGSGYCDITNVSTIGSGGSGGSGGLGTYGGGLIILNATSTLTINGSILARGESGSVFTVGGAAGGGVKLTANTITGTPTAFSVAGGDSGDPNGGGGGGGCVQITYTTSNSVASSSVVMRGSTNGAQHGGAGQLFIKQSSANYGDLYSINSSAGGVSTTQVVSDLALNSISLANTNYVVSSAKSLTLVNSGGVPFENSSSTAIGTINVSGAINLNTNNIGQINIVLNSGSTFTNSSTITIDTTGVLQINSGATVANTITSLTSSGTLYLSQGGNFTINTLTINSGTTTLANYTTSTTALNLSTLTINGGAITHGQNTSLQSNILNISANNINIQSGGSVNVDNKGYGGSGATANGYGPGGGGYNGSGWGSGAGHGGNGGSAAGFSTGGLAYCDITNVSTIGSGGSGGSFGAGSYGGGLIILNATSTLTINGSILARGESGSVFTVGGAAGGGVKLTANTITGTPTAFSVSGGNSGSPSAGTAGGGCVQITYTTTSTISSSTVNRSGGTGATNNGSIGLFSSTSTPASTPTSVVATTNSATQITLSWSGDGTEYYAQNTTASTTSGWTTSTSYAFTSLTCNTSYSFHVKARNVDQVETSYSSTVSATTSACPDTGGGGGGAASGGGGSSGSSGGVIVLEPTPHNINQPLINISVGLGGISSSGSSAAIKTIILHLNVKNAASVAIAEESTFTTPPSTWVAYQDKISYTILNPLTKTLYLKFRSSEGIETSVIQLSLASLINTPSVGSSNPPQLIEEPTLPTEENIGVPLFPNSAIIFNKLPISINPGKRLTYTYSYKNTLKTTERIQILRQLLNEKGKVVLTAKGVRTLKSKQSFTYSPNDILTKKLPTGVYTIQITVLDSKGKQRDLNRVRVRVR